MTAGEWQQFANCATTDPDLFVLEHGGSSTAAKRICAVCPVRASCLQEALDRDEQFGIWGGMSLNERKRLSRGDAA